MWSRNIAGRTFPRSKRDRTNRIGRPRPADGARTCCPGKPESSRKSQLPYSTISTLDGSSRKKAEPLLIPESRNSGILSREYRRSHGSRVVQKDVQKRGVLRRELR